jgi:homoserine dehydrogenase
MNTLKIAVAGIGTVGSGLLEILFKNKTFIEKKIEKRILISAVASRTPKKILKKLNKSTIIFDDAKKLLDFNDYDLLVELIGGEGGIAKEIIINSLNKNKSVVTANKALVAQHGIEILKIAEKKNCKIAFEAAVAGGVPVIKVLKEFLLSNKIKKVFGILNGTSNYILSKMEETNKDFSAILKDAQEMGYAESDPSFDIDGTDTAHKLSILSMVAYGKVMDFKTVFIEGIEKIEIDDIKFADTLGYKIKLLGITQKIKGKVSQFVYPCLVDKKSTIASVNNVNNGIFIESDFSESLFLQGQGAGAYPTATSVISDIIDISNKKTTNLFDLKYKNLNKIEDFQLMNRVGSYYLRLSTIDKPGVIAGISKQFKEYSISMKSMLQKDSDVKKGLATIVLTTHNCQEKDMKSAIKKINSLDFVMKKTIFYRIEVA